VGEAGADGRFQSRTIKVHGHPALQRYSTAGELGEVAFLVARRFLVQLRLVPAANEAEVAALAESIDTAPLEQLALDGVTH